MSDSAYFIPQNNLWKKKKTETQKARVTRSFSISAHRQKTRNSVLNYTDKKTLEKTIYTMMIFNFLHLINISMKKLR